MQFDELTLDEKLQFARCQAKALMDELGAASRTFALLEEITNAALVAGVASFDDGLRQLYSTFESRLSELVIESVHVLAFFETTWAKPVVQKPDGLPQLLCPEDGPTIREELVKALNALTAAAVTINRAAALEDRPRYGKPLDKASRIVSELLEPLLSREDDAPAN